MFKAVKLEYPFEYGLVNEVVLPIPEAKEEAIGEEGFEL